MANFYSVSSQLQNISEHFNVDKTITLAYKDRPQCTLLTSLFFQGCWAPYWRSHWSWGRDHLQTPPPAAHRRRLCWRPSWSPVWRLLSAGPLYGSAGPAPASPPRRVYDLSSCPTPSRSLQGPGRWSGRPRWPEAILAPWAVALNAAPQHTGVNKTRVSSDRLFPGSP